MTSPKIALCLPSGGITGAMYQIGALCALEDALSGFSAHLLDLYVGSSAGSTVALALAGGLPAERLYRALLDPADNFFPLERSHLLRTDLGEWRRTLGAFARALGGGVRGLAARGPAASSADLWEQLDRLYDALPAGLFTLEAFERFLGAVCARRGVPATFPAMPRPLRVVAYDLDDGSRRVFGAPGSDDVPVARAVCASIALPLFFCPVRIGDRHYIDGSVGRSNVDLAVSSGAELVIVVHPMVPLDNAGRSVPTAHGRHASVRDKGLMWVYHQAHRIGVHARLDEGTTRADAELAARGALPVLRIEPNAEDALLFLHHPASFLARREILEWAYKTTREGARRWAEQNAPALARLGLAPRSLEPSARP